MSKPFITTYTDLEDNDVKISDNYLEIIPTSRRICSQSLIPFSKISKIDRINMGGGKIHVNIHTSGSITSYSFDTREGDGGLSQAYKAWVVRQND